MHRKSNKTTVRRWGLLVGSSLLAGALGVLFSSAAPLAQLATASRAALRRPSGGPLLESVQPLAPAGEMLAALQEPAAQEPAVAAEDAAGNLDRAPERVIRDTYPTYSAIAVDTNSNEIYMQDENLYGYKVFNRLENTPPRAAFTEPKRSVSGLNTRMEYNCGLYVDPASGDVYSVNNDTLDNMTVFPRDATGDVKPMRQLDTPHGSWGIAVDESSQQLFLTVEHQNSVVVYRKMASGDEKPLRTLVGDKTQLADPHGITLDPKNHLLYVSNHGNIKTAGVPGSGRFVLPAITVYSIDASGNTAPLRVIQGPKTQLDWPAAMSLDTASGDLYVANDAGDSMLVFHSTDNGDVAPARVVKGPKTEIRNPTGVFVDTKNKEVWLSNMGNHRGTVYSLDANGDAAPLRVVRSAPEDKLAQAIGNPGAVAYDTKREQILVPN